MEKLLKNRMKSEHIVLADIGPDIKNLAKRTGIKPKELAAVLVPIYQEAVKESLHPSELKKSMKKGWRGHHHSGEH